MRTRTESGSARAGFTLVEMLVVVVILMILLGLLFIPMFQSFQATKRAETASISQDRVALAMQQLVKDLEEAVYVYPPPDQGLYRSASVPDAMFLSFLDMRKPATEGEIAVDRPGGALQYGNRDKVAYPLRPSERIVRYFVAPLPGHPSDLGMWGGATPGGYINPFLDAFADLGSRNLAVLYRAEFALSEIDTLLGLPSGTTRAAHLQTPYFYTGETLDATGARVTTNAAILGPYWKAVSTALTDSQTMDCALYEYDGAADDEVPILVPGDPAGSPASLEGALPGFSLLPKVVMNETMAPSELREATAYRSDEPYWSDLGLDTNPTWTPGALAPPRPVSQVNSARDPNPLNWVAASYTAQMAAAWTGPTDANSYFEQGGQVIRLLPKLDPVTGQLKFARRWTDVFHLTVGGPTYPDTPPDNAGCLQVGAAVTSEAPPYPAAYRVTYGLFRGLPLDGGGTPVATPDPLLPAAPAARTPASPFNSREHFRLVKESEVVQLADVVTGQLIQLTRVETQPIGPYQYRIDYDLGIIRFDPLQPPDPVRYALRVDYEYRDNFEWAPSTVDARGFVDDSILATYVSRREMTVGLNIAAYDLSAGEALTLPATRVVRLRNAIQ